MDPARSCISFAVAVALLVACGGGSRSNDNASAAGAPAGNAGNAGADVGGSSGGSSTSGGTPSANSGGASSSDGGMGGQSGSVGAEGGASGTDHGGEGGDAGAPDTCEPITDDQCTYDRQLTLAPPTITDEDEDGLIEPGEKIVIHSGLHNPGPLDHSIYPGVTFTTSHPDLQPQSSDWHDLFAMSVGQSQPFKLELELSPDAIEGSTISITIVPSGINAHPDCCGQHAVTLDLLVE